MNIANTTDKASYTLLIAEDDFDDRLLLEQAFEDLQIEVEMVFVKDGEELMHYLRKDGESSKLDIDYKTTLILLDLNLPKKDGRIVLKEIKSDPELKDIPTIIWTTSRLEEDIKYCENAGADFYISKPSSYTELMNLLKNMVMKWLPSNVLP
jgi:CheY-like chemotaxis protein